MIKLLNKCIKYINENKNLINVLPGNIRKHIKIQ